MEQVDVLPPYDPYRVRLVYLFVLSVTQSPDPLPSPFAFSVELFSPFVVEVELFFLPLVSVSVLEEVWVSVQVSVSISLQLIPFPIDLSYHQLLYSLHVML